MTTQRSIFKAFSVFLILVINVVFFYPQATQAGSLTALSDTMSRLADSSPTTVSSNHAIKFTTASGVAAAQNIQITFPAGFTIGSADYTDIDVSWGPSTGAENELTLAAAASGATWGAVFAGQVLSITSGSGVITASSKVIVEIGTNATNQTTGDQQIQNHATAGTYTISIAGTFGDTGKIAIVILADDQFSVTANVDPSLTFSLSATSTDFGTLSSSSVTTSSPNITLTTSTNAQTGYSLLIKDTGSGTNPGLFNASASSLLGSADGSYNTSADLTSVAGYGIQATSATASITAPYNSSSNTVGGYKLTPQTLATYTSPVSDSTVSISSKAKVSGSAPAGSYTDTVTVIAVGNF